MISEKEMTTFISFFFKSVQTQISWLLKAGLQIRVCTKKLIFLFLNQNICYVYSKEPSLTLNETVLLSTHNICLNWWIRKYLQFYAQKICISKLMILELKDQQKTKLM